MTKELEHAPVFPGMKSDKATKEDLVKIFLIH